MAKAKQNLASMSVHALLKLKHDIGAMLNRRADSLKKELAALGADYREVGRIAVYGKKKARKKMAKVAAKYRDPKTGATWSGRGAPAGWISEYEKKGKKRDQFLIMKGAKKATKKTRRKKR